MNLYKTEIQLFPMPRSIENIRALAIFRGAMINKTYAESFEAIKIINN